MAGLDALDIRERASHEAQSEPGSRSRLGSHVTLTFAERFERHPLGDLSAQKLMEDLLTQPGRHGVPGKGIGDGLHGAEPTFVQPSLCDLTQELGNVVDVSLRALDAVLGLRRLMGNIQPLSVLRQQELGSDERPGPIHQTRVGLPGIKGLRQHEPQRTLKAAAVPMEHAV